MWSELEKADNALRSDKKEWTIVAFSRAINLNIVYKLQPNGTYSVPDSDYSLSLAEMNYLRIFGLLMIHSVRRESDGEVFTIGDEFDHPTYGKQIISIIRVVAEELLLGNNVVLTQIKRIRKAAMPFLKGKDSYLVVGGHIPCAFYTTTEAGEGEPIWYIFDEKKQGYQMQGWQSLLICDLHYFENPRFHVFYNDKQKEVFEKVINESDKYANMEIATKDTEDWNKYIHFF